MIEKIIHQVWVGPRKPPFKWLNSWRDMHPDWEYHLWTDKNLPSLKNRMSYILAPEWERKADILRYEVLYNHGGIYIDADTLCLKRIDKLLDIEQDVFAVEEGVDNLIANGVIGCSKRNKFMKKIINNVRHDLSIPAWVATGPAFLTGMINKEKPDIKIYPAHYFWPYHHSSAEEPNPKSSKCKNSYGLHYWGTTRGRY